MSTVNMDSLWSSVSGLVRIFQAHASFVPLLLLPVQYVFRLEPVQTFPLCTYGQFAALEMQVSCSSLLNLS